MTKYKLTYTMRGYSWSDVVTTYMGMNNVRCMDEVIRMSPRVDKQAEAIYSQLIAEAQGIA